MKVYIKNNTDYNIDMCYGDWETELQVKEIKEIEVHDEDCLYIDQIIKNEE